MWSPHSCSFVARLNLPRSVPPLFIFSVYSFALITGFSYFFLPSQLHPSLFGTINGVRKGESRPLILPLHSLTLSGWAWWWWWWNERKEQEGRIASCFICPQESTVWLPSILTIKRGFREYPAAGRASTAMPMSGLLLLLPHYAVHCARWLEWQFDSLIDHRLRRGSWLT